ncbi:type II toxin-antitoxin system VapC family toxin [Nocardia mangyaensis]|uniref:type II toxin-antitoxin system VapC family toxin n=1 Tax=Nocardia mangyaensis TaxID=2213200 RepID=UPI002675DD2D|nr:PIN domain-containing protein [Nocardia mangyaensis]MDO3647621.1 PIN domain-containing protein [Nocardia mangyaensis]
MIVCDTGPLLAVANKHDNEHDACLQVLSTEPGPLIVPAMIVTEVCYMLGRVNAEAEANFLRSIAVGELRVESHTTEDYLRIADLVVKYRGFPLGAADASVVAVAERLRVERIATLDHRHFRQVLPAHCGSFELFPAESQLARHR